MITFYSLGHYGQLGNQLFQYATLRAVAEAQGYEMRVPMRLNAPKSKGLVELGPFALECEALEEEDARRFTHRYIEKTHAFDPDVFDVRDWTDLAGYFQSEKYFKHLRRELLRELSFRDPIGDYAARYIEAIRARSGGAPLVAVHVRRGDYLEKNGRVRVLAPDWYRAAMDVFARSGPVYLFFSDDPGWCIENFGQSPDPESILRPLSMVQVATPDHWHDLAVMLLCDHFVISASSFSWWGAWLSQHPNKVVVAPKPWFGPGMNRDESDIVPEEWRRI